MNNYQVIEYFCKKEIQDSDNLKNFIDKYGQQKGGYLALANSFRQKGQSKSNYYNEYYSEINKLIQKGIKENKSSCYDWKKIKDSCCTENEVFPTQYWHYLVSYCMCKDIDGMLDLHEEAQGKNGILSRRIKCMELRLWLAEIVEEEYFENNKDEEIGELYKLAEKSKELYEKYKKAQEDFDIAWEKIIDSFLEKYNGK